MQRCLATPAAAAAAAILCLTGAPGCIHTVPVKAYAAPALLIPTNKPALMSAVRASVEAQDWEVVHIDARAGTIEAVTPAEHGSGVATRERWKFLVEEGAVTVSMTFEMGWGGVWRSGRMVCEGYEYLRERSALTEVWTRAMPHEKPPPMPEPEAKLAMIR